ncbi:SusD/RagB family nutrient-binding outer membrane lipoprotein [Chitinophaga lutea]
MRLKNILYTLALGSLTISACTKDFKEINTNPTLIGKDVVQPSLLFTYAIRGFVFQNQTHSLIADYAGYYKNGASGNIFLDRDWSSPYNSHYRTYLINFAEMMRLTKNDSLRKNQYNIGRICRAMVFQQLTDCYGDVPYFDALQSVDEVIVQPRYDTQEAIYRDMLKELKEAYEALENSPTQLSLGNADILLKGNVDGWRRLANSLRLRMAMRVRYAAPDLAKEHILEALTRQMITTNAQNVKLATLNDGNADNANTFYTRNQTSPNNMLVSFTLTDNLKALNDPRLPLLARPANAPAAGYRGVPLQFEVLPGMQNPYQTDSVSRMATSFLQQVIDIVVMNAAEVFFLRAEAALSGISTEDAQSMYRQGIQAAMQQYGVAAGNITTYLASPAATLSGTAEQKLEQIIVQKWLGIYYNIYEGWAEFRRTGYPRIWTGKVQGVTEGNVPRRLTYPVGESLRNGTNLNEAVSRLTGGDRLMSRVWWDKKPGLPFLHPKQGQDFPD